MAEFVRSLAAQGAARCIIETARQLSLLSGPVTVSPRLAEAEKQLIIRMMAQLHTHIRQDHQHGDACAGELSPDEVSSLFTFVFAKAAEAVTNMVNKKEDRFELTGMLDGRIPLYADEGITAEFKQSNFPFFCAKNYLEWIGKDSAACSGYDPLLLLAEALKWCFRLSCHLAVTIVEAKHPATPAPEKEK